MDAKNPMGQFLSQLTTPRLDLELLNLSHAPSIMEARVESFKELKNWDIFTPESSVDLIDSAGELRACEWRLDRIERRESLFYSFFLRRNRRFLGICSLTKCNWNEHRAMLGFWLRTSETGKGYAAEAAKALLQYGTNILRLKIYSFHASENQKSRVVLLKLGTKQTHVDKACHHLLNGRIDDEIHYDYLGEL